MITIEYTSESVENEPGPNIYWCGECHEYLQLLIDLRRLGSRACEFHLEDFDYIHLVGFSSYRVRSVAGGEILCRRLADTIEMELKASLWREILHNMLAITFVPSFTYQEFPDKNLIVEANVIMRSNSMRTDLNWPLYD